METDEELSIVKRITDKNGDQWVIARDKRGEYYSLLVMDEGLDSYDGPFDSIAEAVASLPSS